ncbi:preprotein translocase subunit SecE [Buchnera aphidicola (Muscaphis stroyani)]|uniref:Protein translocase subunit SecE n=1 Tax=Buchnera aphidicola (Muscaphis stroyani) TaxID=1241869 RepID=A0A4D6Y4X9_9GAMM|nr:preprotein translocase subunit SecE [Buchnera aphidicola]QCI24159.1 preprotein translocase subunit SecE [Buchnera aphidicola (Muscaphis stroyani)]
MNTNTNNQKKSKILEKMKWISLIILIFLYFIISQYCGKLKFFIHLIIMSFLVLCAVRVAFSTEKGKNIYSYINASKMEIQKIIWPEYKETLYTTCAIIFVTILISILLWSLDSIIFRLIAFIIRLRF